MVPTSLPELPKPSRTSGESQKPEFLNPKSYMIVRLISLISLLIPLKVPIRGGVFIVYRLSAKERLYLGGWLTYPRTETSTGRWKATAELFGDHGLF